jgi:predicted nucleotidyltransferase
MNKSARTLRDERHRAWWNDLKDQVTLRIHGTGVLSKGDCVYLFGSRAGDRWGGSSDTDLLVVLHSGDESRRDTIHAALAAIADDVVVATEQEIETGKRRGDTFWCEVDREKRLIMEMTHAA